MQKSQRENESDTQRSGNQKTGGAQRQNSTTSSGSGGGGGGRGGGKGRDQQAGVNESPKSDLSKRLDFGTRAPVNRKNFLDHDLDIEYEKPEKGFQNPKQQFSREGRGGGGGNRGGGNRGESNLVENWNQEQGGRQRQQQNNPRGDRGGNQREFKNEKSSLMITTNFSSDTRKVVVGQAASNDSFNTPIDNPHPQVQQQPAALNRQTNQIHHVQPNQFSNYQKNSIPDKFDNYR